MPDGMWEQILLRYGLPGLGALILLLNLDKLGRFADGLLQRLIPSYEVKATEREHRRQMEIRHVEQVERERVDTILVFRDMMLQYRKRLDDLEIQNRRERAAHEERMLELVRNYERTEAQVVEALRDVSEVLRAQGARLDRLCSGQ